MDVIVIPNLTFPSYLPDVTNNPLHGFEAAKNPNLPDPNGDSNSLFTTNRTATFMGPSLNLLSVNNVVAGATYQVSAYVLLDTGEG